jgi:hypothetical protein
LTRQSVGNFNFSAKAAAIANNTYNKYTNLLTVSEHVPKHNSDITDNQFGYFLAGLIEGDG